jgi:hypothetical protein
MEKKKPKSLEDALKERIAKGESTKSDRLIYAKINFRKNRESSYNKYNPIKRLKDNRAVSDKKINRIVAGKKLNYKEKLLDGHAESLADKIKAEAEAKKKIKN